MSKKNLRRALLTVTLCGTTLLGGTAAAEATPAAPATTHHTAESCSGKSNGFCLYNADKSLSGWSPGGVTNNSLMDWAYHGSSTSIGDTLYYAIAQGSDGGANCGDLELYTKPNEQGLYGGVSRRGGKVPTTFQGNTGSFQYLC